MNIPDGEAKPLNVVLTFRGIDVPTTKILGKDACGFAFRQVIDGREQDSTLLFAYPEGNIWKTVLADPQPGKFRLTLISNRLHCSKDIVIDADALARRELRVGFNCGDCRGKMFPVFIQRWCWNLQDLLEKRKDHPRRDHKVLSQYRRRFRRGPFGTWLSALDDLTLYGSCIEFRRGFTGTISMWGLDDQEIHRDFRWKVVGDFSIDVQPIDGDLKGI